MTARRVDICQSCNEEGEIAAHGLCYPCYRRVERRAAYEKEGWNPGDTRRQKRLARAHSKLIEGLLDFGAGSHANAARLIDILAVELMPLAEYLGSDVNVNRGQGSRSQREPAGEECRRVVDGGLAAARVEKKKNPGNKVSPKHKSDKARRKRPVNG